MAALVEGTLQLVADPLAATAGHAGGPDAAAPRIPGEKDDHHQQQECWVPVYQSRAGGYQGASGITVK